MDNTKESPIGIMPKIIWREKRFRELISTISRYFDEGRKVPLAWFEELLENLKDTNMLQRLNCIKFENEN